MKLRRLIRTNLANYRWPFVGLLVLQSLQALASMVLPGLNGDLIDNGVMVGDTDYIWRTGGVMLLFTMAQIVLAAGAVYVGSRIAMGISRDVRRELFSQVTEFSAREVAAFGPASLITRITNDVQQVQILIAMVSAMALAAPMTMIFGIILALREDLGLSVTMWVAIPIAVVVLGVLISRMVPAFQQMQVRIDRINQVLREQITGIRVVRAFTREDWEIDRFAVANAEVTSVSLTAGRVMAFMIPSINLIVYGANIAVLALGASRIESGDLQIGSLIAYLTYLLMVLMSVVMTTFVTSMIPRASVAAERIIDVLDTPSSVTPPANPVTDMPQPGSVEMVDAGFQYPGAERPVLRDISFQTSPGTTTAIIGGTGSGKTTLVNMVLRLFDATEGEVRVNGVNVRELAPEALWGSVGYVPQKAFLFSGTVASNLRFGNPDATDDELWEALRVAQAADFVQTMPDGIDSAITQGGGNVSGGQRQRLSIARALVAKPDIYIFDDSFSALDLSTEAELRAALRPHTTEASVITVAQRISTIRDADQIIVLDGGEIVGLGTHDELLTTCGTYQEIVESQFTAAG